LVQARSGKEAAPPPAAPIKPPSAKERMIFFRSFAALFKAGIPIERSLDVLGQQTEDLAFRALIVRMTGDLTHGHSLTAVFSRAPEVFTSYHVRMIRVGEMTGKMDDALAQMAIAEEKSAELVLKVKSALTYPAWCMALATVFLLFVPPYLMDGLFAAVSATGAQLPLITVIVNSVFTVCRNPVFQLLFASASALAIYYYPAVVRSEKFKSWILGRALRFPGTKRLAESIVTARFGRSFSTMLEAGVAPALALRLAGEEVGTNNYKEAGVEALYRLENGASFPQAVRKIPHLRSYFHELLKAGEETGTMSDMTQRAAAMAEEEVEHQLEVLTALLEPFVMMIIGGVVGILVISSMLPMLSVLQSL
jgi:type IV pilus assembly protein PilC